MEGILSGGLLVAVLAAVAGCALAVTLRLFRITRPSRDRPDPGQPEVGAGA